MELDLDNRLYILRNANLPEDFRRSLSRKINFFLMEREIESEAIVDKIKLECKVRGIALNLPDLAFKVIKR